mmetsp:Transcript_95480/g.303063  ORF Transcript_95480/g.303063 Transcript_95480/m.303063 type:complete len:213 (-) Transcript_95480:1-639(-)
MLRKLLWRRGIQLDEAGLVERRADGVRTEIGQDSAEGGHCDLRFQPRVAAAGILEVEIQPAGPALQNDLIEMAWTTICTARFGPMNGEFCECPLAVILRCVLQGEAGVRVNHELALSPFSNLLREHAQLRSCVLLPREQRSQLCECIGLSVEDLRRGVQALVIPEPSSLPQYLLGCQLSRPFGLARHAVTSRGFPAEAQPPGVPGAQVLSQA